MFFFQAEDGIRDYKVTGVQTCALPIYRVLARSWLMPLLREKMSPHSAAHIAEIFEKNGLPFAPIARPQDLLEDPHLNATGALAPITLPDGRETKKIGRAHV